MQLSCDKYKMRVNRASDWSRPNSSKAPRCTPSVSVYSASHAPCPSIPHLTPRVRVFRISRSVPVYSASHALYPYIPHHTLRVRVFRISRSVSVYSVSHALCPCIPHLTLVSVAGYISAFRGDCLAAVELQTDTALPPSPAQRDPSGPGFPGSVVTLFVTGPAHTGNVQMTPRRKKRCPNKQRYLKCPSRVAFKWCSVMFSSLSFVSDNSVVLTSGSRGTRPRKICQCFILPKYSLMYSLKYFTDEMAW